MTADTPSPRKRRTSGTSGDCMPAIPELPGSGTVERPTPVAYPAALADGAALADAIMAHFKQYVALPSDAEYCVSTLWTLQSYTWRVSHYTPYLSIPGLVAAGKSTLLEVLESLVNQPCMITLPTASVIVTAAHLGFTLLIDETNSLFGNTQRSTRTNIDEIVAVLCSGYKDTGRVQRGRPGGIGGNDELSSYCPKVLAGTSALPAAIESRSIVIRMKSVRRQDAGLTPHTRHYFEKDAAELQAALSAWGELACDTLRDVEPADYVALLDGFAKDRSMDIWEPLFNIADLIGGEWPERARAAAIALSGVDADTMPATPEDGIDLTLRAAFRNGYVAAENYKPDTAGGAARPIPDGLRSAISSADLGWDIRNNYRMAKSAGCTLYISGHTAELHIRSTEWNTFYYQIAQYADRAGSPLPCADDMLRVLRDAPKSGLHTRTDRPKALKVSGIVREGDATSAMVCIDVSHWLFPRATGEE